MLNLLGAPRYALTEMSVRRQAHPESEPIVLVQGRKPGLIGLLLTAIGIEPICRLAVTERQVLVHRTSLFGTVRQVIPMNRVASAAFGVMRPLGQLVAAVITSVLMVMFLFRRDARLMALVFLALGVMFIVRYIVGKAALILIESTGGAVQGLAFKGALIGGKRVDLQKAEEAVLVIRDLILACDAAASEPIPQRTPPIERTDEPSPASVILECPSCGHRQELSGKWAGKRVKCPRCNGIVQLPA